MQPANKLLYFLPGFMGSALTVDNQAVWLDMAALMWGDFSRLSADATNVSASAVLASAYQPLLDSLATSYTVQPFAYDWRLSFLESGKQLAQALTQQLDAAKAQQQSLTIRFLAQGAGGLVLKGLKAVAPEVWQRVQTEAGGRSVLLGTPLNGTFSMVQLLLGQHRLIRLLDSLDGKASGADNIADQFATYAGVLEQLPLNYVDPAVWGLPIGNRYENWAGRAALSQAQSTRAQWDAVSLEPNNTCYVHGKARLTPNGLSQQDDNWRFQASIAGDGVTTWASVANSELPQWFMPVEHGRMASHPAYFGALLALLDTGTTDLLSQHLPPSLDSARQWLPPLKNPLTPDESELRAAGLGYHTRQTQAETYPLVEVRVTHGNLEHCKHPIAVGHYDGDAILSAESVLDRALDGRLSDLLRLGLYPGAINTYQVFFNKQRKPGGAIVIGLGDIGKLSVGQLSSSYMWAMTGYAVKVREALEKDEDFNAAEADFIPVHVSSLLMGTLGGGGLGMDDAITAMLRGICQANTALEKTERGLLTRIQSFEIIELYEDRAIEAAHLVHAFVQQPEFRNKFTATYLMQSLPGSRRRVYYNEGSGWWRRIQIDATQNGLKYTALTDRARAEMTLQATQRELVDQFIERAVTSNRDDPEVGKVLYELLWPADMKDQPLNADNLVLVLDDASSAYPWELLYNRLDAEGLPLAVRSGLLRQLQVTHYRQRVLAPLDKTALVIGDPQTEGVFEPLPAARAEADKVAKVLEAHQFKRVVKVIGGDAQSILQALHSDDYRVMHLAGHGVYRYQPKPDAEPVTGMVLGNGIFLTAVEISQMRRVPELAFVNCCHLAKIDPNAVTVQAIEVGDRAKLASSLAQELIRMGVRAVIAAGWTINDAAAKLFAATCYEALLQGYSFGKAVLMARQETWQRYPNDNTWGAYQCYGDPDYQLVPQRVPQAGDQWQASWQFVAAAEVVAELENFINRIDSADLGNIADLKSSLRQLHKAIPSDWLQHPQILAVLGKAYGRLEMYPQALAAYETALQSQYSEYPLSLLEDKAGLQTAWALAWAQQRLPEDELPNFELADKPLSLLDSGLKLLKLLEHLGNSQRRLEEEAKLWKRRAMLTQGADRRTDLEAMQRSYQQAHEFALQSYNQVAPYPLVNWLTIQVLRAMRNEAPYPERAQLKYWSEQAKTVIEQTERNDANFKSGINLAEYALLQYLSGSRLEEPLQVRQIINAYQLALSRGAAPRQISYIQEHLGFLRLMLSDSQAAEIQPILQALTMIQMKLG